MHNFKLPKKDHSKPKSVDGFIVRRSMTSDQQDVRKKFSSVYKPNGKPSETLARRRGSFGAQSASHDQFKKHTLDSKPAAALEDSLNSEHTGRLFYRKNTRNTPKKSSNKFNFKKTSKVFGVLVIVGILGVSSLFAYGFIKANNIFKGDGEGAAALEEGVDPARLNGEGDGRVNILMIGKGGPGETAPDLTDTLLLASVDPIHNEAALLSVPRDLYVTAENGYESKINEIYSNEKQRVLASEDDSEEGRQRAEDAGLDALKTMVSDILGVPVHYYVMVDFASFERAIDTVGGVTIDVKNPVSEQMYISGQNYYLDVPVGQQDFNGIRALAYSRCRKCDARSDFGRSERQREIIVALQKKILSLGTFSNPFKVVELLNTFGDGVRTDLNGLGEIKRLYEIAQNTPESSISSYGLADPPQSLLTTGNIGGQSIVLPTEGLFQYAKIQSFVRNNLRDGFLRKEDARVVILNGTTQAGLASATSEELKSYGYNVISVDNAPTSDYVQNRLIDLTGDKKYTKSYLEKRLNLTASQDVISGLPTIETADFVIILGTDEITQTSN